jgi:hypothetical protein
MKPRDLAQATAEELRPHFEEMTVYEFGRIAIWGPAGRIELLFEESCVDIWLGHMLVTELQYQDPERFNLPNLIKIVKQVLHKHW